MSTPRRVVSLTPSNTEVLWALDALDRLVGVDDHSDFPADLVCDRVGPDLQIDIDAVEALEPDLVLASLSVPGMERIVDEIEARDLPAMVLAPKSLEDILRDHERIGTVLGLEARAAHVAADLQRRIDRVRRATSKEAPARVLWEWWPKPLICAGGPSWMTEVIEAAGGVNVCADMPAESPQLELDEALALRPDVVGVCWCGSLQRVLHTAEQRVRDRPGWRGIRVLPVDEALFGRPGPRIADGLELLAWLLHPDAVDTPDVPGRIQGLAPRGGDPVAQWHGTEVAT